MNAITITSNIATAQVAAEGAANDINAWLEGPGKTATLPELLKFFAKTRDAYEALDEQRKRVNELVERMSRVVIPERMAEEGVGTISLRDASLRFTVSHRISASVLDKDAAYEWLRSNGHGDLIQPTVNSSALAGFAKKYIQDEGKDLPAPFKISQMAFTSVTKL